MRRSDVPGRARWSRRCPAPAGCCCWAGMGAGRCWRWAAAMCRAGRCRRRRRRRPRVGWGGRAHRGRPGPMSSCGPSAPSRAPAMGSAAGRCGGGRQVRTGLGLPPWGTHPPGVTPQTLHPPPDAQGNTLPSPPSSPSRDLPRCRLPEERGHDAEPPWLPLPPHVLVDHAVANDDGPVVRARGEERVVLVEGHAP